MEKPRFNVAAYYDEIERILRKFDYLNRNSSIVWNQPCLIKVFYDVVRILRPPQFIICVRSKDDADRVKSNLLEVPSRLKLKVKIITDVSSNLILSCTTAHQSHRYTYKGLIDKIKSTQSAYAKNLPNEFVEEAIATLDGVLQFLESPEMVSNHHNEYSLRRLRPSHAFRITYYDSSLQRRRQCSLGTVLIVVLNSTFAHFPEVILSEPRKTRSDAKVKPIFTFSTFDKYGIFE